MIISTTIDDKIYDSINFKRLHIKNIALKINNLKIECDDLISKQETTEKKNQRNRKEIKQRWKRKGFRKIYTCEEP